MGQKLIVGPLNRGLRNDVTPFNVDNDSFPTLINAYQWRSRVKRKRGTSPVSRLKRYFDSTDIQFNPGATTITLDGGGNGNLITGFGLDTISPNASIVPGSVTITAPGPNVYTDPTQDGTLSPSGTINYATGAITIAAEAGNAVEAIFNYYPTLPVMGLEDLNLNGTQFPGNLEFDTVYSYNLVNAFPYPSYAVNFYKNPSASASLPGYTPKTSWTPTTWNGQDYQQFWSTNYQSAFWVTNGIETPFIGSSTSVGMQFNTISSVTQTSGAAIPAPPGGVGTPAIVRITLNTSPHLLEVGDFVFANEIQGTTGLNFQTGYVINNNGGVLFVDVEFPNANAFNAYITGGILQYLTNRLDPTVDCIRWYDGDPTNGDPNAPIPTSNKGWVNFMPPLSQGTFSINDIPPLQYYLAGARMIVPFKDRLLFFGPVVQASSGNPIYLPDTVIYSQNGAAFYTASFLNSPDPTIDSPVTTFTFNPILVPDNQTAHPAAYFEDQTGFGGFRAAGLEQPAITVSSNEDVLIVGFQGVQTQLVYSGNDIVPFNFFLINSELGSSSTFSSINMDKGVITRGSRGFVITSQRECQRIDLEIPDEVFEIKLTENGTERVTAQRDFINEWLYETYPSTSTESVRFPTRTLQYNYRDNSWGMFFETYTTYGLFRKQTGFTWQTVGFIYPTWNDWNDPWNAGTSTLLKPEVIAGNQQGYVVARADGTGEANSLAIQSFSTNTVTSPDHCLNNGDFIVISGCTGSVAEQVNGKIFKVANVTTDTFTLAPPITSATYFGLGEIKRIYKPFIQTRQFPISWELARKTRLGPQQYLFTSTPSGRIQLLIFLSQNNANAYNEWPNFPDLTISPNGTLIYSTTLFTCPEGTNLGLTPANINLQSVTGAQQQQIWHRMNTSLLGDTVQIGFTLSDENITTLNVTGPSVEITGITNADPCVISLDTALQETFAIGELVQITEVEGTTELNGNTYLIIDRSPSIGPTTSITIDVDSTAFGVWTDGGLVTPFGSSSAFAEIELHSMILDVSPSQMLA